MVVRPHRDLWNPACLWRVRPGSEQCAGRPRIGRLCGVPSTHTGMTPQPMRRSPMPVEMGIWRIDGEGPRRLTASRLPSEATLENFLEQDPALLGTKLLVIGRQVRTPYGKFLDLLAIDADGNLHVLELKRDRTPREVVAQVLDYGSWVSTLGRDEIIDLANTHLDEPFASVF